MSRLVKILVALVFMVCVAEAQSDIRKVDFKNFTYEAFCIGENPEKVAVKNGEFSEEKQEDGYVDRFYFKVFDIAYGDLTSDGKAEAIVLSVCNTGGTGNFSEGFIYSMKAGKPSLIGRIPGGDRAYGGLRSARVMDGLLVVESNDVGELGGACCPEFVVTTRYRMSGGKLTVAGKPDRQELFPAERITFARGSRSKTIQTKIRAGELKRFVVGARTGQTLTVSVPAKDTSVRLLDDADLTENPTGFTAKLPRNGDYTIEVQNISETDLTITLNIKIN